LDAGVTKERTVRCLLDTGETVTLPVYTMLPKVMSTVSGAPVALEKG
jgi:hypothetical protein